MCGKSKPRSLVNFLLLLGSFLSLLTTCSFAKAEWGREPHYNELDEFNKVSLGFASQNLQSPISSFGHTFLIFHNGVVPEASSITVEFTGDAPDLSSSAAALFTSIPGKYSLGYFADKRRQYDGENRSLWVYLLNLDEIQVLRLQGYVKKTARTEFKYDFSRKNCAFYIAQLISRAEVGEGYKPQRLFVTPVDSLKWARNSGLIDSGSYYPSTQIGAIHSFRSLSRDAQNDVQIILAANSLEIPSSLTPDVARTVSLITEHLIPREPDVSRRNHLFSLKRKFPAARPPLEISSEDPLDSSEPYALSITLLPKDSATILTISPGFSHPEIENSSNIKNSTLEAFKLEVLSEASGKTRINDFHFVNIASNQPSEFLSDGFTQSLEIAYTDYWLYLDKCYKETKAVFGRGISYRKHNFNIAFLPLVSIASVQSDAKSIWDGHLEGQLRMYGSLGEYATLLSTITRRLKMYAEIQQTISFEAIANTSKNSSISLTAKKIIFDGGKKSIAGIKFTYTF